MASSESSIVSKLNLEMEQQLLQLFSKPVRLHLLFQASRHGFRSSLQNRFDEVGKFIIIVYLKTNEARGAYFSKSGKTYSKWFLFDLTSKRATSIPNQSEDETYKEPWSYGNAMNLRDEWVNSQFYVDFSSDEKYNTGWKTESIVCRKGSLIDLEMFRVHGIEDELLSPWREISWQESTRDELRESIVSYQLMSKTLKSLRILLLGPAGAGKSSFINSIRSVMYRRVLRLPIIGTASDGFTKKLASYSIRAERGGVPISMTLCDVPPPGDSDTEGLSYSDTLAVINGHVSDGYKFRYDSPISPTDPCYRAKPKIEDRIHCVAFCLSASEVMGYSEALQKTYKQLHAALSDLGIPQVILLTQVDQVCHAVSEDVSYVYRSRIVQERMQKAAELLGMPLLYVFPLKNYNWELTVSCHTDILLLATVQHIQETVNDTLEDLGDTLAAWSFSPLPPPPTSDGPHVLTV